MDGNRQNQNNNEEIGDIIKNDLQDEVLENKNYLEGMEEKVLNHLREQRKSSFEIVPNIILSSKLALASSAALLVIIGLIGGFLIGSNIDDTPFARGQGIEFMVAYPEAKQVSVIGDFTNWQPRRLQKKKGGLWFLELDLKPGRYEYNFVVDGKRWVPDPRASDYALSYGQYSSVIYVGGNREGSGMV
jgi:hypothetical protein